MKNKIKELVQGIYLLEFNDSYNLAMHFCRFQEFYESHNPDFYRKSFSLIDFMEWYSIKNTKKRHANMFCFTYPEDWAGFNIPSWVFDKLQKLRIPDINRYDIFMLDLHKRLKKESGGKYYLIGTCKGDINVIAHEIAHGLYYSNPAYKKEMIGIINSFDKASLRKVYKFIRNIGYNEDVVPDETQAFLSTGLSLFFSKKDIRKLSKSLSCNLKQKTKLFESVFFKYARDIQILKKFFSNKA